jgi:hypothetical protein
LITVHCLPLGSGEEFYHMRNRFRISMIGVALVAVIGVLSLAVSPTAGQAPAAGAVQRIAGKPNMTGLWQALNDGNWDLQDHSAAPGPFYQLGAAGAMPPGQGIVEGNEIPYLPAALAKKRENQLNRMTMDPEIKCYMPGIPRAMYMPYPFQIVQSDKYILMAYAFASSNRIIHMDNHQEAPVDSWMGWSNGKWEGDTLVIEVKGLNGQAWFDRAGNYGSENLRIVERLSSSGPNHINYEATIEDKTVYSKPWKVSFPLYRRLERNVQLLDFKCVEFSEEMLYGHLRKRP